MKVQSGILSLALIFCGVLALAGTVSASSASDLQPASVITYNEELVVNHTGRFNSVYIGKQGVGGVTFFNGTIVNSTKGTNNSNNPVTFGDDVRIDGQIYRTEVGGSNNLKLADSIQPQTTNTYSLGTSALRMKDGYFAGTLTTATLAASALSGTGIVNSTNILDGTIATADLADSAVTSAKITDGAITTADLLDATIATADLADSSITSAKITNGTIVGSDISSSADLSVDRMTTNQLTSQEAAHISGELTVDDNIVQDNDHYGAMKAGVLLAPLGLNGEIASNFGYTATSVKNGTADYSITFEKEIVARYFQVSPSSNNNVTCNGYVDVAGDPLGKTLRVKCYTADTGLPAENYFHVIIY